MACSTQCSADGKCIEAIFTGMVLPGVLAEAVKETLRLAADHRVFLILSDCTRLEGGHTFADLFGIIDELRERGLVGLYREAVLLPARTEAVPLAEFWVTACLNRGFTVRLFTDRGVALDWLYAT